MPTHLKISFALTGETASANATCAGRRKVCRKTSATHSGAETQAAHDAKKYEHTRTTPTQGWDMKQLSFDFTCPICSIWFCDSNTCKRIVRKRTYNNAYYRRKPKKEFIPDTRFGLKYDRRRKPDSPRRQWERNYRREKRAALMK